MNNFFQTQIIIPLSIIVMAIFFPILANAHPGHGSSEASHFMEHLLWLVAGISLLAFVLYYAIKKKRND